MPFRNPRPAPRPVRRVILTLAVVTVVGGCGASSTIAPTLPPTPAPASATLASTAAPSPTPTAVPALKDLAGGRYFGTALALPQLASDAPYAQLAAAQFNQVTPENAMKWGLVEPVQGQFDWSGADAIVAFAQAHGQKVRGHTLLWHTQLPDWLSAGKFNKTQLNAIVRQHIATEVGRYAGKVYAWDVVNEPLADDGTMRDTIFYRTLGPGYIADAFRWARAADPSAKLYINDYGVEGIGAKSEALYSLVKSLLEQGVPIDGVGFQAHFDLLYPFPSDMAANLQRFAALGLDVAVTELDVRVKTPVTAAELSDQASYYKQTVAACVSTPRCVGVTVWGFTDKYSWVPYSFPGEGAADLYDQQLAPKPAVAAVIEGLMAGH